MSGKRTGGLRVSWREADTNRTLVEGTMGADVPELSADKACRVVAWVVGGEGKVSLSIRDLHLSSVGGRDFIRMERGFGGGGGVEEGVGP